LTHRHTHTLPKGCRSPGNSRQLFRCTKHNTSFSWKLFLAPQAASIVFLPLFFFWLHSHIFFIIVLFYFLASLRGSQAQDNILLFCNVLFPLTLCFILCGPASLKVFQTIPPSWVWKWLFLGPSSLSPA